MAQKSLCLSKGYTMPSLGRLGVYKPSPLSRQNSFFRVADPFDSENKEDWGDDLES